MSLCLVEMPLRMLPSVNTCVPSDTHLYLLTVTSSTRAASPPSTTKTCTTTRISGTCKSFMAHITETHAVDRGTYSKLLSINTFAKNVAKKKNMLVLCFMPYIFYILLC